MNASIENLNNVQTSYGSTANSDETIEQLKENQFLLNNENEALKEQELTFDDQYDDDDVDDDDEDDDAYLLSNGKNSKRNSKFIGYRKSILNKLPFRFPRSRRHANQKLLNISSSRPQSVNTNIIDTGNNAENLNTESNNFFYKSFSAVKEKLFPSWFILNNEENSKMNKLYKGFKLFIKALPVIKTLILVSYTVLCISLFMIHGDEHENWYQSVISINSPYEFSYSSIKDYKNDHETTNSQYVRCILHGPFKDVKEIQFGNSMINSINYVRIDMFENNSKLNTSYNLPLATWTVNLIDSLSKNTYTQLIYVDNIFEMNKKYNIIDTKFRFSTTSLEPLGINFDCKQMSQQTSHKSLYATLLLIFVYGLIMFDIVHRTLAAALGAIGGLSVMSVIDMNRPTLITIASWVEWETLLLMFGMMIIVAIFCETGLFDLIAVQIFRYVGNRIWIMFAAMCLLAAVLSAFLDNVTTILLLSPITIKLSEVLNLDPRHLLIAQVLFSNIGGTSTAIGDPPNVIITAHNVIQHNGVDFANFTLHMLVGSIIVYIVSFIHFRVLYSSSDFISEDSSEINELNKEIMIWKRTFKNITPITKEEKIVKTLLKEKVSQLENLLNRRVYQMKQDKEIIFRNKTDDLIQTYKINSKSLLIKCIAVFIITLIAFFIHPFIKSIHLSIGWIAILSAITLLTITATSGSHNASSNNNDSNSFNGIDLEAIIHKVEWSTLLFFSCLFIFMRTIEELGLLHEIGSLVSSIIKSVGNVNDRLVVAIVIIILISALVSSVIDNIPFTTAMIPIIIQLNEDINLPLQPLTYALAFGSCLGGNGTLVGASCNLVAAGISEQHGYKISFIRFFKVGFPVMLSSVLTALIYMCITSSYLKWY